ncbi:MAG TPA: hypothetical protein PLZ51_13445, partial [Aggregatilineales bacterium]|nr:hypothetical protein [Aggregatilineales bacterium]
MIGVITNDETNIFQSQVIAGIRAVADKRGYAVAVDSIAQDPLHPKPISLDMKALSGELVIANV